MRTHRFIAPLVFSLALGAVPAGAQSLRGSPASVDRMYNQAQGHDLHFYRTGRGVRNAADEGDLVRLSGNEHYRLVGVAYPYVLPSTRTFVRRLAEQYHDRCGERLVVTSATRPRSVRLLNSAGNKSVHAAGMAIDLRKPSSRRCLSWLRGVLLHVEGEGAIEATEEFRPPHFHVAVFPRPYMRYVGGDVDERPQNTRTASRSSSRSRESGGETSGQRYRVRRGDSLWAIARRHGTSVERLKEANDLRSSRVVAGQTLLIPAR